MLLENDFSGDTRVRKEINTLAGMGHKIILAAVTPSKISTVDSDKNCIVYRKPMPGLIRKSSVGALKFPFYFQFWRRYVSEILDSNEIDLVHIHDLPLAQIGIELKSTKNIRVIIDLHENWPDLLKIAEHTKSPAGRLLSSDRQWRNYEKSSLMHADGIITVVREMKDRIINIGIAEHKVYIVENTPVISQRSPIKEFKSSGVLNMVYLGGLTYHRGLQYVLEGLSLIREKTKINLRIIGDGSYSDHLRQLTRKLDLGNIVSFTGQLNKNMADEMIKQADIGLIPHLKSEQSNNSSPNKLYDYMYAGLAVVASDCKSIKRIIDETRCGLTYVFDSATDFAGRINYLNANRDKLKEYSANGRAAVEKEYNWDTSSANLNELYKNII